MSLLLWGSSLIIFDQRRKFIARRLELADVDFSRKDYSNELTEFTRDYIKMVSLWKFSWNEDSPILGWCVCP